MLSFAPLEFLASQTGADVFPIGGVVPLMEKNHFKLLAEVIISAKKGLDISRPVHLFGCGHPMIFALASFLGCDLFDSASYAKFAARDSLMFTWGTRNLDELEIIPSEFSAAPGISIEQLKAMEKKERQKIIAKHNLIVSFTEIAKFSKEIFNNGTKNLAPFSNFIKNLSENFSIIYGIISIIFAIVLGISAAFIRRFFSNLRKKYIQKN